MSGFATGLNAGVNAASKWVSLYNAAKNEHERRTIADAAATENTQFSPEQGTRLSEAAANGANVTWDAGLGGYNIAQNAPADGMGPAQTEFVAPRKAGFTFMGKQYDQPFNPDNVALARRTALADHAGFTNPEVGLRMQERATSMYEADQARTLKRQTEALEAQAGEWLKGASTEDLVGQFSSIINPMAPAGGQPYGMLNYDAKTGGATMIYDFGGKSITANLTPAQVRGYARQAYIAGKGDMAAGVPTLLQALQGAQEKDAKDRVTALNMDNVTSQIGDRVEGRKLQERQLAALEQYRADTTATTRRGQDVQAFVAGSNAGARANRTNRPATVGYNDSDKANHRRIEGELKTLQGEVDAGRMTQAEAAARRAVLQKQWSDIDKGAQDRTHVANVTPIVEKLMREGQSVEAIEAQMRAAHVPQAVIERTFGGLGLTASAAPAPAVPRQGMTMPSHQPAPAPTPKQPVVRDDRPAPAPKATPGAARDFYGEDATAARKAAAEKRKEEDAKKKAEAAAKRKKQEDEAAESRRKIAQSVYDNYRQK